MNITHKPMGCFESAVNTVRAALGLPPVEIKQPIYTSEVASISQDLFPNHLVQVKCDPSFAVPNYAGTLLDDLPRENVLFIYDYRTESDPVGTSHAVVGYPHISPDMKSSFVLIIGTQEVSHEV